MRGGTHAGCKAIKGSTSLVDCMLVFAVLEICEKQGFVLHCRGLSGGGEKWSKYEGSEERRGLGEGALAGVS